MTITNREVIDEFRDQQKQVPTDRGMVGSGGAESANRDAAGGDADTAGGRRANPEGLSRGERFDQEQGGGRGEGDLEADQRAHQDRGQSFAEDDNERGERS